MLKLKSGEYSIEKVFSTMIYLRFEIVIGLQPYQIMINKPA